MKQISLTDLDEVKDLCDLTTSVSGLRKGSLSCLSRKSEFTLARMVVANIARREKAIHYNAIAKVMNRDRSNIYHYENKHSDYYEGWREYRELFNRVYNMYNDLRGSKRFFKDKEDLRNYLRMKGVKDAEIPTVRIIVNSGVFEFIANTDYKNFSNQLEFIRLALKNYDYKLEVKL